MRLVRVARSAEFLQWALRRLSLPWGTGLLKALGSMAFPLVGERFRLFQDQTWFRHSRHPVVAETVGLALRRKRKKVALPEE